MCGIIGISAARDVASDLIEGLRRLEYRGYDSAGIATLDSGHISRLRAEGKLQNLASLAAKNPARGHTGIGHTRWATHGVPSEANAHPHATERVAVVHNGIIENFESLRAELLEKGYAFSSQTDSETIPVLITACMDAGLSPQEAVASALKRLHGAYAFAAVFRDHPGLIIGARHGAPLAVGHGTHEMYIGSDSIALSHLTQTISYLDDGDWVVLTPDSFTCFDKHGSKVERPSRQVSTTDSAVGKGNYAHFMLKEIYEQPAVIAETLAVYYSPATKHFQLPSLSFELSSLRRIHLVACGTSYYAAVVARYWLEDIARIPVDVDIASEFRYREPILAEDELTIVISQSGETADTLAALRYAKMKNHTLGIVNVPESSIAREADAVLHTLAGPEIGVASTKAFTTQLATLACFTLSLAEARGTIMPETLATLSTALLTVSSKLAEALHMNDQIALIAEPVSAATDVLYLGRGTSYAIAYEGALKLKEISYIHAEAYAAGEMKHGPIALIDETVPIIAIAPNDVLFDKTASNLQEGAARGGKIILISDAHGCTRLANISNGSITMPDVHPFVAPILYALPVQLLAYHVALLKGTDVDQPRNLAKSVTVE